MRAGASSTATQSVGWTRKVARFQPLRQSGQWVVALNKDSDIIERLSAY